MALTIRAAVPIDLSALADLYNYYVENTPATFDIEPFTAEQRRAWFDQYTGSGPHRLLVADRNGNVVGYACSSRLRAKAAYATSVETSIYLAPEAIGEGIGTELYLALFRSLEPADVHRAYAGITLPNPVSVALHRRLGFVEVGVCREVGRKFGRYWDVLWLEKPLDQPPPG